MAVVHKNVLKAARQAEKRRLRNRSVLSGVKHNIKKLQNALEEKKPDEAAGLLHQVIKDLAKAAVKGVLHRNTASRKISRLTAQVQKLGAK